MKRLLDTLSPKTLECGLASGRYQYDEDGELERRCSQCREYWPADSEFFFSSCSTDGLHTYCKACYSDHRWPNGRRSTPGDPPAPRPDGRMRRAIHALEKALVNQKLRRLVACTVHFSSAEWRHGFEPHSHYGRTDVAVVGHALADSARG